MNYSKPYCEEIAAKLKTDKNEIRVVELLPNSGKYCVYVQFETFADVPGGGLDLYVKKMEQEHGCPIIADVMEEIFLDLED